MWRNRVLFHAFDIYWTAPRLMLALSAVGLVWTGILLAYILRRAGKRRALTAQELSTLGRSADPNQVRMQWSGAKGGRVEANANIDTLRRAAKRGDWGFFWAWPCMLMSAGASLGLFFFGVFSDHTPTVIYVVIAIGILPFLTIPPFMAWAALYTNIDLDVDEPEDSSRSEAG